MMEGAMKDAQKKGLTKMDSVDEDDQESSGSERSVSKEVRPDVDQESSGSEYPTRKEVMQDVAAAPASALEDKATVGEEVEVESTKPTSPWIILAPPGKLGIVIDATVEGPVVHRVSVGSVMKLKLAPGDVITSIDRVKTAGLSAEAVYALMSARAQHERILTVETSQSKESISPSA
jgi:hypothetical protein